MEKRQWLIRGFDSLDKIYEKRVPLHSLSDKQVEALLPALVSKAGLTFDEIVGAYARRRTRIANDLLRVQRDGPRLKFTCGTNPHFIATVAEVDR